MIHWITGAVNAGKSTYLQGLYKHLKNGDGFYNRKVYHGDHLAGQELVHLATGESRLFSAIDGFIPGNWDEECRYQSFSFSKKGLEFGRKIIETALFLGTEPLFIDEIGPLELQGQGFHNIFSTVINTSIEIYAVVRYQLLDQVIQEFGIKEFMVIEII